AVAEAGGDAGPHRALAVTAMSKGPGPEAVGEQVAADERDRHEPSPRRLLPPCLNRQATSSAIITTWLLLSQVGWGAFCRFSLRGIRRGGGSSGRRFPVRVRVNVPRVTAVQLHQPQKAVCRTAALRVAQPRFLGDGALAERE